MNITSELERLSNLYDSGNISQIEYNEAKRKLLDNNSILNEKIEDEPNKNYICTAIHFTQLLNFVAPFVGVVVPIVLWQMNKNNSPQVDRQGKIVANWMVSQFIYIVLSLLLSIVFIGFIIAIPLAIVGIAFPIIAGIKALNGEEWVYPLSINFFGRKKY